MKFLSFPKTKDKLNIGKLFQMEGKYQQTRIVPKHDSFVVEVIYLIGEKNEITCKERTLYGY